MTTIEELDKLAKRFIIGHKGMSQSMIDILKRIESLKKQERILENRKVRIGRLILAMYGKLAEMKEAQNAKA